MYYADHSPTTTRPFTSRTTSERSATNAALVHNSSSPRSMPAANLFLPSLQSCDSINLTATGGLIDFSSGLNLPPVMSHPFPSSSNTIVSNSTTTITPRRNSSPTQSLEALTLHDQDQDSEAQDTPRKYQDAPTRRSDQWPRRSLGATTSAPTSAIGSNWTRTPGSISNTGGIGLGLDYEAASSSSMSGNLSSDGIPYGRRESNTSSASGNSSRRSSVGRTLSNELVGGGVGNISSGGGSKGHTRRTSASRSGFSHLPPSPATSGTTLPGFTGSPIIPINSLANVASPSSTTSNTATPTATTSLTQSSSNRSGPENRRLSYHSQYNHQSSPSMIAASILRSTRDFDHEGIRLEKDMDLAQANDTGTAEAMRKLDGLATTSPRTKSTSNLPSSSASSSGSKPRTSTASSPASLSRSTKDSEESRPRRRTRSSTGGASIGALSDTGETNSKGGEESYEKSPPLPSNSSPAFLDPSPTMTSTSYFQDQTPRQPTPTLLVPMTKSPIAFQHAPLPRYEIPFPSATSYSSNTSSPAKRASSSSASMNAGGNSTSTTSRDSTSGTSFSGSSSTAAGTTPSSTFNKHRRGSGGSDVSSTQSSVDLLNNFTSTSPSSPHSARLDRLENTGNNNNRSETDSLPQFIPPVPPLPKDWESYRPTAAATTPSSTGTSNQNSPRFESQKSFDGGEFQQQQQQIAQQQQEIKAPAMEPSLSNSSTSKTPTRKWSLSFGKSKSPKPPIMKESTSYADLSKKGLLNPKAFSTQLAEGSYGRRMAASSNDIVGLATRGAEVDNSSSKLRHSLRGDFSRNHSASIPSPIPPRNRTTSTSSNSTSRTTTTMNTLPTPTVVTTSPGRSRSSLLSPRRTPSSGIPFFSRKSSNASTLEIATPPPSKSETDEKSSSGRKSILGLNFLRSNSSKKEKESAVIVPPAAIVSRQTIAVAPTSRTVEAKGITDEFGRRASLVPKTTSLITRKRGKVSLHYLIYNAIS